MRTDREKAQERYDVFKKIELVVVVASTLMLVLFMARSFSTQTNADNTNDQALVMWKNMTSVWKDQNITASEEWFQVTMVAVCLHKAPLRDLSSALQTVMKTFECKGGILPATCNNRHSAIAKAIRAHGLMPCYNHTNIDIVDATYNDNTACLKMFNDHASTVRQLPDWEKHFESEKQKNIENSKFKWSDMWTPIALWATAIWATIIMLCMIITAICRARFVNLNQFKV
jgi:ABC-type sugar transport system permease subunit